MKKMKNKEIYCTPSHTEIFKVIYVVTCQLKSMPETMQRQNINILF